MNGEPKDGYEQVFRLLQNQPIDVATDIFERIRHGSNVLDVLRYVQYGSLRYQLSLVPDTTFQYVSPHLVDMMPLFQGPFNPYLDSKLYKSLDISPRPTLPSTSSSIPNHEAIYSIPYPGTRIEDARLTSRHSKPALWTSISSDDAFVRRLLETYFLYEFPFWPCFQKDFFLDDMSAGIEDHCSSFLVNVILTAGCVSCALSDTSS